MIDIIASVSLGWKEIISYQIREWLQCYEATKVRDISENAMMTTELKVNTHNICHKVSWTNFYYAITKKTQLVGRINVRLQQLYTIILLFFR